MYQRFKERKLIDIHLLDDFIVEKGLYTDGMEEEYTRMITCAEFYNDNLSDDHSAYIKALAWIATDIMDHTEDTFVYSVESLMWLINKGCVHTSYYFESK